LGRVVLFLFKPDSRGFAGHRPPTFSGARGSWNPKMRSIFGL
jgi:hypothetical protein